MFADHPVQRQAARAVELGGGWRFDPSQPLIFCGRSTGKTDLAVVLAGQIRRVQMERERAMAFKEYDLRFTTIRGFEEKPVRVQLDVDDNELLRQHLIDLAVRVDGRPRSRPEDWLSEYTLRVCEPDTHNVVREFTVAR